jgi:hypothetical protein
MSGGMQGILYNLLPGMYQIGNMVFGHHTTVPVENIDVKPHDVNAQDYQVSRSDEKHFGWDNFSPSTIELTFDVLENRLLPPYEDLIPNFWDDMPTVNDFARVWRADNIRQVAGAMEPLYICAGDGITRAVYGRPGQFTYGKGTNFVEATQCIGEFRRADTLSYTAQEQGFNLEFSVDPVYMIRDQGDGPDTWLRLLLIGPLTNPVITIGDQQVSLNYSIAAGKAVEVSSYPWQRRVVSSDGLNLTSNLDGVTRYLDKLKLPYGVPIPLKWTADQVNTIVPILGDNNFLQNIETYSWLALPSTYTTIAGQAAVGYDLFDFGSLDFPWWTPRKYLARSLFASTAAIIYNAQQFNTAYQYSEAQIVSPLGGKSAIVIMSTPTMSSFACVEVEANSGSNWLHIRTGTGPNALTTRVSWPNPDPLGWHDTDKVAIGFDPPTKTYTAYLNGSAKVSWTDSGVIVPTGSTNRSQGFIFDTENNWFQPGTGFCNSISYDTAGEDGTGQTGEVLLLWRDSWSIVG